MAKGQSNPAVVWGGSALLALMFLVSGALKLLGPRLGLDVGGQFVELGYPDWFGPALGGVEIAAAVVILIPRIAWLGALVLMAVTAGYLCIFWRGDQPTQAIGPGLLFLTCAALLRLRYPKQSTGEKTLGAPATPGSKTRPGLYSGRPEGSQTLEPGGRSE